jgi:hypothetical protein
MNKHSWWGTFVVGGLVLAGAGQAGCSFTTNTGDDSSGGGSGSGASGTGADATASSGEGSGSAAPDGSSGASSGAASGSTGDAGTDAPLACGTETDAANPCDICLAQSCCATAATCQDEPTDAATTECADILDCVAKSISPPADAGVDAEPGGVAKTMCEMTHSAQAVADFEALYPCIQTNCATQCF